MIKINNIISEINIIITISLIKFIKSIIKDDLNKIQINHTKY